MKDLTKQEHYTNNGIEPIEIMRKNFSHDEFVGFCKGNVLKYLLRYKDKNGLEDLEKAKIYLNWLVDELVAEPSIVSTNDFAETEIPNNFEEADPVDEKCEEPSNFKKYLAWKQTLDDLRKVNNTKGD